MNATCVFSGVTIWHWTASGVRFPAVTFATSLVPSSPALLVKLFSSQFDYALVSACSAHALAVILWV